MPKDIPYYWGEGQPRAIRFSYEDTLGGYLYMFKIILNLLEIILEAPMVAEPSDELNTRYVLLLEYFYSIHATRTDFKHIPNVRFDKFASLIKIDHKFIQSWKDEKPKYVEQLRIIDGQYKSIMYGDSLIVPRNLTYIIDSLARLLTMHQKNANPSLDEKRKPALPPNYNWESENVYNAGSIKIEFTSTDDNDRKILFKMLTRANGEPVKVSNMGKKIKKSPQKVRIIIAQLKDKVKITNLTILTERKGAYWLSINR